MVKVSPRNTSRTCPRCGYVTKARVGGVFKCGRCGFEMDRQKLASMNIYLRYAKMWGSPTAVNPRTSMKGAVGRGYPERVETNERSPKGS
ncbi:MAG: zinc ribbon domain-containing protein [Zestosphaera sp.]